MINSLPSNYANAVTPYAPLGRQAVGEENTDLKSTSFKPLEESAAMARGANERSPDERPGEVEERERTRILNGAEERESQDAEAQQHGGSGDEASERRAQEEEREEIRRLAARDREVRAHERAHATVGGLHAGAPSYQYERGPDGVSYAVAGEVNISVAPVPGDPQATLEKAEQIQRAAQAPAEPSAQDRRVAARAAQLALEARAEIQAQQREERRLEEEEAAQAREQQGAGQSSEPVAGDERRAEQAEEQERREERARIFAEISARNIEINRRLIEIGVIEPPVESGLLLSQRV